MAGSLIPGQPLGRGSDALIRRIEALERKQRELGPSIAKSFQSTADRLVSTNLEVFDATDIQFYYPGSGLFTNALTETVWSPGGYEFVTVRVDAFVSAFNSTATRGTLTTWASTSGAAGPRSVVYAEPGEIANAWSSVSRTSSTPVVSSDYGALCTAHGATDSDWGVSIENTAHLSVQVIRHN